MTAPNPAGVRAASAARSTTPASAPSEVDAINGHLTATGADPQRGRAPGPRRSSARPATLPPITSTKSMIGHALGAAGAIESVASVLMLHGGFVHASINCEDVHPEIAPYAASIPHETAPAAGACA